MIPPATILKAQAVCVVVFPAVESFSHLLLPRLFFVLTQAYVVCAAVLFFSRLCPALPSWTSSLENPWPPSSSHKHFPHKILNGNHMQLRKKCEFKESNLRGGKSRFFMYSTVNSAVVTQI